MGRHSVYSRPVLSVEPVNAEKIERMGFLGLCLEEFTVNIDRNGLRFGEFGKCRKHDALLSKIRGSTLERL
jgi:hypothetical protein